MHLLYFLVLFLLCFFGALSNVGGFVFIKLFFQQTNMYSLLELDIIISICMLLMTVFHLIKFRRSEDKELVNRPELVMALCTGVVIGSILGTLTYFYIYNTYGESSLISIQNIIIFALALNSLMYNLFSSYVQTFDVRTFFPCIVIGVIIGFFCSLSSIGLIFILILIPLLMFNTSYVGAKNVSMFILFFTLTTKIIITYLISPIPLSTIPYLIKLIIASLLANYLGTYFQKQISQSTKFFLYNLFLIFILILSMLNFH